MPARSCCRGYGDSAAVGWICRGRNAYLRRPEWSLDVEPGLHRRIDGSRSNRVIGSDARLVWKDIYSLTVQGALSRTTSSGTESTAPLWQGVFARAGRRFGMRHTVRGVDPDFRAAAGFISRTGVASGNFNHQVITYGGPGSPLERWSSDVVVDGTWQYDELMAGGASQDRKLHFNNNFTWRGGWRVGGSVLLESFGYRPAALRELLSWQTCCNFYEWPSADIIFLNVGAAWKPTEKLRVDARYQLQSFRRRTDDSIVGIRRIPRLKAEYQISRPIFVRVVGEYNSDWQDDRRDDSRTNLPIYILNRAAGQYDRAAKQYLESFRADWLFSYQPTPGTVVFAGYGNTLANLEEDPRTARLRRTVDGFFLKVSYLFRL